MILDITAPTLVLLGAWNPRIFQGGWIGKNLFGYEADTEIRGAILTIVKDSMVKEIPYLDDIGIHVTPERMEIYPNSLEETTRLKAEEVAANVATTLPHTPFGAVGVNFNFVEDDPENALLDALQSADSINQSFRVVGQEFKAAIQLENGVILNFSRSVADDKAVFDFNFHHPKDIINFGEPDGFFNGLIQRCLTEAEAALDSLYGLRGYEIAGHEIPIQNDRAQ